MSSLPYWSASSNHEAKWTISYGGFVTTMRQVTNTGIGSLGSFLCGNEQSQSGMFCPWLLKPLGCMGMCVLQPVLTGKNDDRDNSQARLLCVNSEPLWEALRSSCSRSQQTNWETAKDPSSRRALKKRINYSSS